MNVMVAFLVSATVSLCFALVAVGLLRPSLDKLLAELCGGEHRARFWQVFVSVSIVLASFFGLLVSFPLSDAAWDGYPQLPAVLGALRMSILFLMSSLGGLALVLLSGIRDFERRRAPVDRPRELGGLPPRPST